MNKKLNINKINLEILEAWITSKTTEILGIEDELLIGIIIEYLNVHKENVIQHELLSEIEPYLEDQSETFIKELWDICQLAEKEEDGIPTCLQLERVNKKRKRSQSRDRSIERNEKGKKEYYKK